MISNSAILEIYTNRIIFNFNFFKKINNNIITAATIKANAYGLGDIEIFKILYKIGCRDFFVATTIEGMRLRKRFKKGNIYILNGTEKNNSKIFHINKLIPIINDFTEYKLMKKSSFNYGLHVDTGINRLGCDLNNIDKKIFADKNLKILISHLASSDKHNNPYNHYQKNRFKKLKKISNKNNIIFSLSNSHGSLISKDFLFNMIRPGIGIYGGHNNNAKLSKKLKPVVKLKAKILQIKQISKNEFIGYNQTYKTSNHIWVAIIGIGYADGISRLLSNKGFIYFKKKKYKIIGRVSMDTITIDITRNYSFFKVGKYVEIINFEAGIDEIANKCKTISNEVITSISKRVRRIYV